MRKTAFFFSMIAAAGLTYGVSAAVRAAGEEKGGHTHDQGANAHTHGFAVGQPAAGTESDRTVEIVTTDAMDFNPDEIEVETGEIIRFVVKNTGTLHHSFTIGDKEWHREHEKQMQGTAGDDLVSHMQDEPNGTVVPPGETRSLTWKFGDSGAVQIGCHVPGHYPAGMKGEVRIDS